MLQFPDKMAGKPSRCLCADCVRQCPERAAELAEFQRIAGTTSSGRYWARHGGRREALRLRREKEKALRPR